MVLVQDVIVSEDVLEQQFLCNLNACKGACCWEGDWGAPLSKEEMKILEAIYEDIKPFLDEKGIEVIEEKGHYDFFEIPQDFGTPLLRNGACAYLTFEENGIAKCGIEKAYEAGATDFKKPISCHLYPIRITENETGFKAMNYDKWDLCKAACALGKKEQLPVYKFLKEAIIRKYGAAFYEEMEAAAGYLKGETSD